MAVSIGCAEKSEPDERVEGSPPAWLASAPPGVRALDLGEVCGSERPQRIGGDGPNPEGRRCLRQAAAESGRASFASALATIDGGAVIDIAIVREDGGITALVDTTRDDFAARPGWSSRTCLELRDGRPASCEPDTVLRDSTPAAFIDREPLRSCGSIGLDLSDDPRPIPRTRCLDRATRDGQPAELIVREIGGEEGPMTRYVRLLAPGRVEVFIDATRGGVGPRTWYLSSCERFDVRGLLGKDCTGDIALGA